MDRKGLTGLLVATLWLGGVPIARAWACLDTGGESLPVVTDASIPPAAPPSQEAAASLPLLISPLLPTLTTDHIAVLRSELQFGIDTWLGLAGVGKTTAPPEFSDVLQGYRQKWSERNPAVYSFLGYWQSEGGYPYSLTLFPSNTAGQVCVLAFKPEWSLSILNEATGEYSKDVISEQILSFSIATVQDGQLISSQIRTVGAARAIDRYGYPVMFMSVMDDQTTVHTVAAVSPPVLPPALPAEIVPQVLAALQTYECELHSDNLLASNPQSLSGPLPLTQELGEGNEQ